MNESELKKLFGKKLCSIRKNKKLTQERLSELIGLDPQYYCKMENGNHFPSVKTLTKIIQALGIKPRELFDYTDNIQLDNIYTALSELNTKELKIVNLFVNSVIKLR